MFPCYPPVTHRFTLALRAAPSAPLRCDGQRLRHSRFPSGASLPPRRLPPRRLQPHLPLRDVLDGAALTRCHLLRRRRARRRDAPPLARREGRRLDRPRRRRRRRPRLRRRRPCLRRLRRRRPRLRRLRRRRPRLRLRPGLRLGSQRVVFSPARGSLRLVRVRVSVSVRARARARARVRVSGQWSVVSGKG